MISERPLMRAVAVIGAVAVAGAVAAGRPESLAGLRPESSVVSRPVAKVDFQAFRWGRLRKKQRSNDYRSP